MYGHSSLFIFQTTNSLHFPIPNLPILLLSLSKVSLFTFLSPTSDQDLNQGLTHSDEDHNPLILAEEFHSQVYQCEPRSQDDWGFTQSQVWRVRHLHTQLTSHPRLAFTCPTLLVSDCDLHQLELFVRAPMYASMSLLLSFTKSYTLTTLVSLILPWVQYLHYTYLYSFINTYQLTIIVVLIPVNPYNPVSYTHLTLPTKRIV